MIKGSTLDAEPGGKLEYVKPAFRTISLVSEEVMAVGCKLPVARGSLGTGPGGNCNIPTPCNQTTNVS